MAETAQRSGNRRRQRNTRPEASDGLESTTVGIYRTSAVVKGGRRFSFGALVVVGDRAGQVGIGYGKAPGVPAAIEKAQKAARRQLLRVELQGETLPHPIQAEFNSSIVRLLPAAPGTGVIAGATVRAVLELAGVRDCLTKAYGSRNQKNLCKAALKALTRVGTREQIEKLRGVQLEETEVEDRVKLGAKYAPAKAAAKPSTIIGKPDKKDKKKAAPAEAKAESSDAAGADGATASAEATAPDAITTDAPKAEAPKTDAADEATKSQD